MMVIWTQLNLFWTLVNVIVLYWGYRCVIREPEGAKALAVWWQRRELEKLRRAFETTAPAARQFLDGLAQVASVIAEDAGPPAAQPAQAQPQDNGEGGLKVVGQGRRKF